MHVRVRADKDSVSHSIYIDPKLFRVKCWSFIITIKNITPMKMASKIIRII